MEFEAGHIARKSILTFHGPRLSVSSRQCGNGYEFRRRSRIDQPSISQGDQARQSLSKDLDHWGWSNGVTPDFSRPGKPTEIAFVVSLNGKVQQNASTKTCS